MTMPPQPPIRDPLAWLQTRVRLWLGAALCALPLGLGWSSAVPGSRAPVRVFLVFAALLIGYAAAHRRTAFTVRLVRAATVAMAVALVLAVAAHAVSALLCLLGGLVLLAPLVWPQLRFSPSVPRPGRTTRTR